ncbi:unannotated protein [freshwater metagenome]|uniref:Unannotated protein n=1 Tax=freshwater metagenome TaxID=449393 RepID=A0A6J7JR16_9ZZZZ
MMQGQAANVRQDRCNAPSATQHGSLRSEPCVQKRVRQARRAKLNHLPLGINHLRLQLHFHTQIRNCHELTQHPLVFQLYPMCKSKLPMCQAEVRFCDGLFHHRRCELQLLQGLKGHLLSSSKYVWYVMAIQNLPIRGALVSRQSIPQHLSR